MDDDTSSACVLPVLPPRKRRKRTNYDKCVLCQEDSQDVLRKGQSNSIERLVSALQCRQDERYERLLPDLQRLQTMDVFWHSNCYKSCTSKHNLDITAKRRGPSLSPSEVSGLDTMDADQLGRRSRSQSSLVDWSKCMFCKNRSHKKVTEMLNASTFEVCQSIKDSAEALGDEDMLHIIRGVNGDLVAAEAKYQKVCFSKYTSKSNIKHRTFKASKNEDQYTSAFRDLIDGLKTDLKHGKAYDMRNLLEKYQRLLVTHGVDHEKAIKYTKQHLKLRLMRHFGDEVVFHQPRIREQSELMYTSSISLQDVLNAAFKKTFEPHEDEDSSADEQVLHQTERTKLLYRTAMLIRGDIAECNGIPVKPLNTDDLSLITAKSLIPDSVYWFLRWVISADDSDNAGNFPAECKNQSDERKVIMVDLLHCSSHARVKTPKHTSLAMAVRHITGSKELITLLNRMDHCSSYDEIEAIDTGLAKEILAKTEEMGVVIPSNICSGVFIQMAGDNNDINEETLDGKHTTHATTLVLYQRGQFGPLPNRTPIADHSQRKRSLGSTIMLQSMQQFSAYGKKPSVVDFVDKAHGNWLQNLEPVHTSACMVDLAWALCRLCPTKLFDISILSNHLLCCQIFIRELLTMLLSTLFGFHVHTLNITPPIATRIYM